MAIEKKIEFWHNDNTIDPFTEWDINAPIWIKYRSEEFEYQRDKILEYVKDKLTLDFVYKNKEELDEITGGLLLNFPEEPFEENFEAFMFEFDSLEMEQIAEICGLLEIDYNIHNSRGYNQGDFATVLIVVTDEFLELIGGSREYSEKYLSETTKTFDHWAWGDVYGFTVYEKNPTLNGSEWEAIESCGGFYGRDLNENGMAENLPEGYKDFETEGVEMA